MQRAAVFTARHAFKPFVKAIVSLLLKFSSNFNLLQVCPFDRIEDAKVSTTDKFKNNHCPVKQVRISLLVYRYYCDYCDTFLTHDSVRTYHLEMSRIKKLNLLFIFNLQPSVRKTHCNGRKHKENVKFYYQKWMEDQAQSLIDATSKHFNFNGMYSFDLQLEYFTNLFLFPFSCCIQSRQNGS